MVNGEYPFEVGIAPIPQVDNTNRKVISQGPSVCIFQQENPQEVYASWLFVKFLTTDVEFQASFSEASGYVPVIKSVNEDPLYKEFLDGASGNKGGIAALSAKVCLEQADAYYVSPAFNGSSKARDEVGLLMQTCFSSYENAADKLSMIKEKFDAAIEECEY
jgi:multiple sugar transport system substrate-binding protein